MLHKFFPLAMAVVAAGSFLGCNKDRTPQPACSTGTVVAFTCLDGVLIEMDPSCPIGAPAVLPLPGGGTRNVGNNVIAVVNTADLRHATGVGQRLYFTYTNDPARQHYSPGPAVCCFANDGSKTPVPHLVLSNVSTISCDLVAAK